MSTSPIFTLSAGVQSYDWGKIGRDSKVAQCALSASKPGFKLEENKPYAELWMGTHPTLPSKLVSTASLLSSQLESLPQLVGTKVINRFHLENGNLPFLFKILSIRKALSIQAHPDKQLAEKLHRERPDLYKDDNHKPEMAIALSDFRALCGFRPLGEISKYLSNVPELADLIPPAILTKFATVVDSATPDGPAEKAALRDVWAALMTADTEKVKEQIVTLTERYLHGGAKEEEEDVKDLVMTIEKQFPGDVGIFCVYLLNVVDLKPGEAIFLGAGEPHAYISGNIVETMATSDNVLRAGLTPKPRDVANLVTSLTYNSSVGTKHLVSPKPFSFNTLLYDPPIPEFSVLGMTLTGDKTEAHRAIDGPSIATVTNGRGRLMLDGENEGVEVMLGSVVFIGAGTKVVWKAGSEGLELFRAFVEA